MNSEQWEPIEDAESGQSVNDSSEFPHEPAARSHPETFRQVSFVRRSGRMTPSQERAWLLHRERYLVSHARGPAGTSVDVSEVIDPHQVFARRAPLTVEIGSGQGHALLHAATTHPERNFLGIEVFRAGLARTIIRAELAGLTNLKLAEANAPEVLDHAIPAGSVDELWVFFPDPWAKARHHKRRLISPDFLRIAANSLRAGGSLRLATDWEDYALHMRLVCDESPLFDRGFGGEWAERFDGRICTAFEQKGLDRGRHIRDLVYVRNDVRTDVRNDD